jgi:serine/threonine protein kinase
MNRPTFTAPSLETMNGLLPAFDFTALIASSAHGAVYMATQRSLERHVAIKILAPEIGSRTDFRASFETTARAMAKLNHPNLIGVYDSGLVNDMLYFVMEFVPGKSLEHSSKNHCVEFSQALKLLEGICKGLGHAHDHGIVHGNLNPSNVLLNQKAEPIIGNFGFSHSASKSREADPAVDSYVAPEVAAGAAASTAADVFAVGATLYRLLTAHPHARGAAPPSELVSCPSQIDALWKKATDPDPAQRHKTIREFLTELQAASATPKGPVLKTVGNPKAAAAPAKLATPSADDDSPTAPKPQRVHSVGFNWKLLRNLVVIAGLLFAIKYAWEFKERKAANIAKQNKELLAKQEAEKQRAIEEARNRITSSKTPQTGNSGPTDNEIVPPPPPPPAETAEESLERLRDDLASGGRSEMPKDSQQRGSSHYLLVSKPLSWTEAAWFAERHGAHLAIPDASADLTFLVTEVAKGSPIWIGAGRSGRNAWTLADGTPWTPKKEPTGLGYYLGADKHGLLRAASAAVKLPFVLQWRADGSNPAELAKVLKSTADSLTAGKPVFPAGTREFSNRFYLVVSRDIPWREAVDLAASSGGHLAVASDVSETSILQELTSDLSASGRFWIGGFLKDDRWLWVTGEPWKSAKWADDADQTTADSALCIRPKAGWDGADMGENLSGFIIEWSADRKGSAATEPATGSSATPNGADLATLSGKAKELVAAADRKRTEALAANAKKFVWNLDVMLRGLSKSDYSIFANHVASLKASVSNNRVPLSIPRSSGIYLNDKMAKIAQFAATTQTRLDAEFAADAERIRAAFASKAKESETKARESGQIPLAESLAAAAAKAANLESWVSSLGLTLQPRNPALEGERSSGEAPPEPRFSNGGDDGDGDDGPLVE